LYGALTERNAVFPFPSGAIHYPRLRAEGTGRWATRRSPRPPVPHDPSRPFGGRRAVLSPRWGSRDWGVGSTGRRPWPFTGRPLRGLNDIAPALAGRRAPRSAVQACGQVENGWPEGERPGVGCRCRPCLRVARPAPCASPTAPRVRRPGGTESRVDGDGTAPARLRRAAGTTATGMRARGGCRRQRTTSGTDNGTR